MNNFNAVSHNRVRPYFRIQHGRGEPNITVNGQKLAETDKFVYLGSTLSRSVNIDEEVSYRIARASAAFGRLRDTVWDED